MTCCITLGVGLPARSIGTTVVFEGLITPAPPPDAQLALTLYAGSPTNPDWATTLTPTLTHETGAWTATLPADASVPNAPLLILARLLLTTSLATSTPYDGPAYTTVPRPVES